MMILTLPQNMRSIATFVKTVLRLASDEGFSIPELEVFYSDISDVYLCLSDRNVCLSVDHSAPYPDEMPEQNEVYGLHYCDQPDFYRIEPDSLPGYFSAAIVLFARTQPGQISEQWIDFNAGNSGSYVTRQASFYDLDDFRNRHLSWFIVALILDFPYRDALVLARAAVCSSFCVSRETWPKQIQYFPAIHSGQRISQSSAGQGYDFPKINRTYLALYSVVDSLEWVERLLRCGVKTVQLRIKDPEVFDLESQIRCAIELGQQYQAQVFINDYWQLAIKHRAYGVHLGQEDLARADLDAIHSAGLRIGISTHSYHEILCAEQVNPGYIALGHIFPTTTKQMESKPQGVVRLKLYQQLVNSLEQYHHREIPTVAIGGINLRNASEVLDQGVDSIAVVRAITQSENYQQSVHHFTALIAQQKVVEKANE